MPQDDICRVIARRLLLIVPLAIVHAACATTVSAQNAKSQSAPAPKEAVRAKPPAIKYGTEGLPSPVIEMRDTILAAVKSGRIEDIKVAVEMNEIKPVFNDGPAADPIAFLKSQSGDGEGRTLLATLGLVLDAGYVATPLGRDLENNRIYIWPYFAEVGLKNLTPAQEVEFYRIVPYAEAKEMLRKGVYNFWRIGIAADGTWHFLARTP